MCLLQLYGPVWGGPCTCCHSLCELRCVIQRAFLPWCSSSALALILSVSSSRVSSLHREGRDLTETSFSGLSVPGSPNLCLLSACGSLYLGVFALLHEEASLMMAKQGTESVSIAARSHFIASFLWQKSSIWFSPRSLGNVVSGSWLSKQCWLRAPSHGVGQILGGYSTFFVPLLLMELGGELDKVTPSIRSHVGGLLRGRGTKAARGGRGRKERRMGEGKTWLLIRALAHVHVQEDM